MDEEAKFHWAGGMNYANEGIKLLFLLNGGATISVLTFVGNLKIGSNYFIYSMLFFAAGAVFGPVCMVLAYLTQLHYGNRSQSAIAIHYGAYLAVILAIVMFLAGVYFSALGLFELNKPTHAGDLLQSFVLRFLSPNH
jgi:hypothetical protein